MTRPVKEKLLPSTFAYDDCREHFEAALAAPRGIRVRFATPTDAVRFRARANTYRTLNRRENKEIYPIGHSMHGQSVYNALVLRIHANEPCYVYFEKEPPTRAEAVEEL